MHKANRELKSLSYQVQRVVASEDALHSLISVRKATDIEVIEQSYMYYKVNCRDQPSPLKIQVVQKESEMSRGKKQDLRLFLSL